MATAAEHGQQPAIVTIRHPMEHYFAIRTRLFDDQLLRACAAGRDQVVLLGAGLDTRAFRLDWPDGVRLFEVDLHGVLDFKESVVAAAGARTRCRRSVLRSGLADLDRTRLDDGPPRGWIFSAVR